jgi:hypothetical protein
MEQQRLFKVRDKRNKGWFWLDNEYLNGYAKIFGAVGTAIYISLCRHSNSEQKCFPSQKLIAEELNIGVRTVRKYLKMFVNWRLVSVQQERKDGKWLNNIYTLLDKEEWNKPEAPVAYGTRGNRIPSPEANDDTYHRHQLPHKKTNRKNTNIRKEKKLFKEFNYPAYKKQLAEKMGWGK